MRKLRPQKLRIKSPESPASQGRGVRKSYPQQLSTVWRVTAL
ncbi:MAG: hypothetical protein RLZZ378_704 [Actinomycetota bacterium]